MNSKIQAAPEWDVEIQRRRDVLLHYMLLTAVVGGLAAVILSAVSMSAYMNTSEWWIAMLPFFAGWVAVLVVWAWRGLGYRVRVLFFISLVYMLGCILFARGGLPGSGRVWLLLLPVLAFVLLGLRSGIVSGVVIGLTYIFFAIAINRAWFVPQVAQDLGALIPLRDEGISFLFIVIILIVSLRSFSQGWLESLKGMSVAQRELRAKTRDLEVTNEQLQRQSAKLQTTTKIAHAGSSILDPGMLFAEVVDRVQEGFESLGVYYVGLFLLDKTSENTGEQFAVLKAATGEAGKLLLEMGHKLSLDDATPVGWCITHRQARITMGMKEGTARFDVLSMPHTRSEIALPLRSRGHILGALNVQSTQETSFDETDLSVLQTMADQIAVAIDNARLFGQTEAALEETRAVHRRYLAKAWEEFLSVRPVIRADYIQPGTDLGDEEFLRQAQRAAVMHERSVAQDGPALRSGEKVAAQTALIVPLKLRGQVIGTMTLHETRQPRPWKTGEIAMAETIAEQVALSVENLRLMDDTQRRASREQITREITDRMRRAIDMDRLLQTAIHETATALGASGAFVQLSAPTSEEGI